MAPRADLVGKTFGRLTVIEDVSDKSLAIGRVQWRCVCVCGAMVVVNTSDLNKGRVVSCGCARASRTGPKSDWTDERVERLKKLWADGLSASQVAAALGNVGRSAVIGKIHRLKLWRTAPTKLKKSRGIEFARKARNDNDKPARPAKQQRPSAAIFALEPYREAPEEVAVPVAERRGLAQLPENNCHWPIGDPLKADFHFCNRTRVAGLPYCDVHCRRAYVPPEPRRVRSREAPDEAPVVRKIEEVAS
jgi:GcrA cell cycle regulator